jgi:3-methyladenine DNA glycosylase AlkC
MTERLKDIFFTEESVNKFGDHIQRYYPEFDRGKFLSVVFDDRWENRELKEKMRHVTICLRQTLPENYAGALEILKKIAPFVKGFEGMVLPDFVELYGPEEWDLSLPALEYFTKFSSSEFAIRPFLARNPQRVMAYMSELAENEDENVRRFASEGCRPRLPWAMALPEFKKDPAPILPILEKLKDDESEFVRRSVANNLNDISKDHPDLVLDICEQWYGKSPKTDWIVKHACRSLLKAGNKRALLLFGHGDPAGISVTKLRLENAIIVIGDDLRFSFQLINSGKKTAKLRLEYGIDYLKANRKTARKIFKITENHYQPGAHSFSRKHSFADMTTRRHYPGKHRISIIVNGEEKASAAFEVKKLAN